MKGIVMTNQSNDTSGKQADQMTAAQDHELEGGANEGTDDVEVGGMEDAEAHNDTGDVHQQGAHADAPPVDVPSVEAVPPPETTTPAATTPETPAAATVSDVVPLPAEPAAAPLVFQLERDELGVPKGSGASVETLALQQAQEELEWLKGGLEVLTQARKDHHEAAVSAQDRIAAIERDVSEKAARLHQINDRLHRDVNGRLQSLRAHIAALEKAAISEPPAQPSANDTATAKTGEPRKNRKERRAGEQAARVKA